MRSLSFGPDGSTDTVATLEEVTHDPNCDKAIRTTDKNFTSGWHCGHVLIFCDVMLYKKNNFRTSVNCNAGSKSVVH